MNSESPQTFSLKSCFWRDENFFKSSFCAEFLPRGTISSTTTSNSAPAAHELLRCALNEKCRKHTFHTIFSIFPSYSLQIVL